MKKLGKSILLFGGLTTILFSGCGERFSINSKVFQGTVISEQRNEEEYRVNLGNHNLDTLYYGMEGLDVIFQGKYFNLEKLDNEINPGMRLKVYGTEASRKLRDNDFIAHEVSKIKRIDISYK